MTKPDIAGFRFLSHVDFGGAGDCMQIIRNGDHIYVGHMGYTGVGTSVIDVSDPRKPRVVAQIPIPAETHSHKVQIAHDVMLVNHEQQLHAGEGYSAGLKVYDVSRPAEPEAIGWLPIDGQGVHRMWWPGGDLVWFSVRERGYAERFIMTADVSDPARPEIVARFWLPGQWTAGGETPTWPSGRRVRAHHVIVSGDRAYGGWGDAGLVVIDVSGRQMKLVSQTEWAGELGGPSNTHTALHLPGRNAVAVTDEPLKDGCDEEPPKRARLYDVSDETAPRLLGFFPDPEGDFCHRGGRYGSHNFHENRPGSLVSEDVLFLTYFSAGLRVYGVTGGNGIREIGRFVPPAPDGQPAVQLNDVFVAADGVVYVSDRLRGGVYILEYLGVGA